MIDQEKLVHGDMFDHTRKNCWSLKSILLYNKISALFYCKTHFFVFCSLWMYGSVAIIIICSQLSPVKASLFITVIFQFQEQIVMVGAIMATLWNVPQVTALLFDVVHFVWWIQKEDFLWNTVSKFLVFIRICAF